MNAYPANVPCLPVKTAGKTKNEVIKELGHFLQSSHYVKQSFVSEVLAREQLYPTGLQIRSIGIAIPHTECEHVFRSAIAVAKLLEPVTFQSMENSKKTVQVHVVFLLALKDKNEHLQALKELMVSLQKEGVADQLLQANSAEDCLEILDFGKNKI